MDVTGKSRGISDTDATARQQAPERINTWTKTVRAWMLRLLLRRYVFIILVIGLMVVAETVEHVLIGEYGDSIHVWYDILIYTIFIPAGAWVLISLLETSETERQQVLHDSNLNQEFSQKLGSAQNWNDLVQLIVQYAHQVAPRATATLFVYNPTSLRMDAEAEIRRDGAFFLKPNVSINPDSLPLGSLPQLLLQNGDVQKKPPINLPSPAPILPPHRYDLPIIRNEQQIGVLKLDFPLGSEPSSSEIRVLKSAAPVIALALEGAILQNLAIQQAAASEAARQQIAQNLHDTLAQNVGYLRLKLDQLTGEHAIQEIGAVLQELERMRATADEAYQQVRNTLDELNPNQGMDLSSLLVKQAHTISKRANFNLHVSQIGNPYPVPAEMRQQILFIVREALHNVEKHAKASEVHLQFLWLESELIVKVTDNGIGFDPRALQPDGHYGLWIMQHRALEIGGTVKITPAENCGTEVTLWAPRPIRKTGPLTAPLGD